MTFAEIGCEQSRLVFKGSDSRVTPAVGAFDLFCQPLFLTIEGNEGKTGLAFPSIVVGRRKQDGGPRL